MRVVVEARRPVRAAAPRIGRARVVEQRDQAAQPASACAASSAGSPLTGLISPGGSPPVSASTPGSPAPAGTPAEAAGGGDRRLQGQLRREAELDSLSRGTAAGLVVEDREPAVAPGRCGRPWRSARRARPGRRARAARHLGPGRREVPARALGSRRTSRRSAGSAATRRPRRRAWRGSPRRPLALGEQRRLPDPRAAPRGWALTKRSSAVCTRMPRRRRPGRHRSGRAARAEHLAGVERIGVAHPGLDPGHREPPRPAATGGRGRRRTGRIRAGRSSACGPGAAIRAPRHGRQSSAASRASILQQPARGHASACPRPASPGSDRPRGARQAWAKSWAARPIRRSGAGRPKSARMGRLSQGPGSTSAGQVPSFSPPSTTSRHAAGGPPGAPGWRGAGGGRSAAVPPARPSGRRAGPDSARRSRPAPSAAASAARRRSRPRPRRPPGPEPRRRRSASSLAARPRRRRHVRRRASGQAGVGRSRALPGRRQLGQASTQIDHAPGPLRLQAREQAGEARRRARPAQDRALQGPRRRERPRPTGQPAARGCLSAASSGTGARPRRPSRRSGAGNVPGGVSPAACRPNRRPRCPSGAARRATRRARPRSGVTRAAGWPGISRPGAAAGRSPRLLAGSGAVDASDPARAASSVRSPARLPGDRHSAVAGRPQGARCEPARAAAGAGSARPVGHRLARHAEPLQQTARPCCGWPGPRRCAPRSRRPPRGRGRAARPAPWGSRATTAISVGRRRDAAGRAGDDHRIRGRLRRQASAWASSSGGAARPGRCSPPRPARRATARSGSQELQGVCQCAA